jgi:hypothetical protein
MSWQKHIFEIGKRYRVKRTFTSGAATFVADEVLAFQGDSYSFYDNCFVYEFVSQRGGEIKAWWLHEDKVDETWRDFFEPLDE